MKLEDQVCSLELAKRLKELGVKQESHFTWVQGVYEAGYEGDWSTRFKEGEWYLADHPACYGWDDPEHQTLEEWDKLEKSWVATNCSAFTVAELGEMLPSGITSERVLDAMWLCKKKGVKYDATCKTEADARAKMLIYLIENKLVKP